ncbi:MAG: DUF1653 domain-containing protein [Pseudomonadota bacterium]
MNTPQKGSVWQHRKGGIYTVDRAATHTETGEWLIVYTGQDGQSWARPESQFMDGRFIELEQARPMTRQDFLSTIAQERKAQTEGA